MFSEKIFTRMKSSICEILLNELPESKQEAARSKLFDWTEFPLLSRCSSEEDHEYVCPWSHLKCKYTPQPLNCVLWESAEAQEGCMCVEGTNWSSWGVLTMTFSQWIEIRASEFILKTAMVSIWFKFMCSSSCAD